MILDKRMRVFLAVAEAGSFSRAARQLSLSQSVISFHVDALEKELGVDLFHRRGRKIGLTREGEFLFSEGRTLAGEARRLEESFSAKSEEIAERIYLAGDALTCAFTLPWTLAEFRESNPDVLYKYEHLDEETLIQRLLAGELDVALVGHAVTHRKLATRACFRDEIALICAPDVCPDTITTEDLRNLQLLWATNDRGLELLLTRDLVEAGVPLKNLKIFMEVSDLPILKNFIRAGVGAAFLPILTVLDELRFELLKTVAVEGLRLERTNYLVYRKDEQPRDVVSRFLEFIKNRPWDEATSEHRWGTS